jgi:hypothetical protein
MFAWIGVALLSISWLVGLGYYHPTNWPAWVAAVAAGTLCLAGFKVRLPGARDCIVAFLLALPACFVAPWPYRAGLILLAAGLALGVVWRVALTAALVVSGCILIVQALGLEVYMAVTARSHELPGPLAQVLGAAAKALGIDSAVFGTNLAAFSMRKIHNLGATWELLVDPASWCFLLGGLVLIAWRVRSDRFEQGTGGAGRAVGMALALVLPVLVWLPLRAALLVALYLHEVLRVDYDAPLQVMQRFWSTPTHLVLLLAPVLFAWRLVPLRPKGAGVFFAVGGSQSFEGQTQTPTAKKTPDPFVPTWRRRFAAIVFALAGATIFSAGIFWDPVGSRKDGRVVIEEYHPEGDKQWERTDKPFDTSWYGHLSGYNYYCIYDYMTRFYDVARRTERLNEAALENCDVLIVKVPTRSYTNQEVEAVEQFVERGGGLMLVGEHTNVFNSGTYLNSIARRFGFTFRYDCLFAVDKVFEQRYKPPLVPHPIVQHLPWMDFATSCSIAPEQSTGRAAMRSVGLKSLGADYHVSNYYPKPDDSPEMRYGAFVQLWATRYGRGRIAAFSDSTIFSNFCAFESGKKELWMGMVEWLNHQAPPGDPRRPLTITGALVMLLGLLLARRWAGSRLVLLAAGTLGWTLAAVGVRLLGLHAMPYPEPLRPYVQVNVDRTACSARLPRNGFISIDSTDYGIFERWILRLGCFTARRTYPEVLDGDVIVFLEPDKPISPQYRARLVRFVDDGGKVLVVDSPPSARRRYESPLRAAAGVVSGLNDDASGESGGADADESASPQGTTTNELIEPFGMSVDHATVVGGAQSLLVSSEGWPSVPIKAAAVVRGGRPFAWVDDKPVGASISVGNRGGSVTVIGFGARFREDQMGGSGDVEPDKSADKTLLQVYDWQYALFRAIVNGKPLGIQEGPLPVAPAK